MSSLPGSVLELAQDVGAALELVHRETRVLRESSAALEAVLFDLVPSLPEADRKRVIKIKRRISQTKSVDSDETSWLASIIEPDLVLAWVTAFRGRDAALGRLEFAIIGDTEVTAEMLRRVVDDPRLAQSLSVLAVDFLRNVDRLSFGPTSKAARTVLSYLVRAAMKPSPLSHLTSVSWTPTGPDVESTAGLSIGFVFDLFLALAARPEYMDAFQFTGARSYVHGEVLLVARSEVSQRDGFGWEREITSDAGLYADLVGRVQSLERSNLVEVLRALGDPPRATVSRLVHAGILRPTVPWNAAAAHPLLGLSNALASVGHTALASRLARVIELVGMIPVESVSRRTALLGDISNQIRDLCDEFDVELPAGRIVEEDSSSPPNQERMAAGAVVDGAVTGYVSSNIGRIFRSHLYDAILARFVEDYGVGGIEVESTRFFIRLSGDPEFRRITAQARVDDLKYDPDGADRRADLTVGRTSAPPSCSVLYQVVHDGDQSLAVLNQLGDGMGGLVARFAALDTSGGLQDQLRAWFTDAYRDCKLFEFIPSSAVNTLQHNSAGLFPAVHWAGDFERWQPGDMPFSALSLRHDVASDTLEFIDSEGRLVAPVYPGIVPTGLTTGSQRLALAVIDPWVNATELFRRNHPVLRALATHSDSVSNPRVQIGRGVVERRASWTFPSAEIPILGTSEPLTYYLLRVDEWRRREGLPREVFLRFGGNDIANADLRKPMWMDFLSVHSVLAALAPISKSRYVVLEEVLPRRPLGECVSSEQVRMFTWDRPSVAANDRILPA